MSRCTGWRAALVVVAVPVVLGANGCGGGGGGGAATSAQRTRRAAAIAAGCTTAQPRQIAASPSGWSTAVRICASTGGSTLLLRNVSLVAVLRVSGTTRATTLREQGGGAPSSLADQAVARVAPASCTAAACIVPPGHSVLASGAPASIDFAAVRTATVTASAARTYGTWTQEERPQGQQEQRLTSQVDACAKRTGAVLSGSEPWQAAYERAYTPNSICGRLVTTVMATAAGGASERPTATVLVEMAQHFDQGAWNDVIGYGIARVSAR